MRTSKLLLGLVIAVCLGTALGAADPRGKVRVWTDQQGRQIEAKLLRVNPDNIVIEVDGNPTFVPLEQLSDADRNYLAGKEPAAATVTPGGVGVAPAPVVEEPRFWKINGKQFPAVWSAAGDDNFVLKSADGNLQISYDVVSDLADAEELVRRLRAAQRPDLAQRVISAYERNTGATFGAADDAEPTKKSIDSPVDPNANIITDDQIPEPGGRPKIATADSVFGEETTEEDAATKAALAAFRQKVMLGGLALVVLIAGVAGYGYMSMKKM